MIVEKKHLDNFTILYVEGLIKLGESAEFFSSALETVLKNESTNVIIDFTKIDYIDSTGIGELVGYLGKFTTQNRKLIVVNPSGHRTRVAIDSEPFVIGRQGDNQLVLRDNRASRVHARIVLEAGNYFIEDLNSRHGVYVNGERVGRRQLANSDRILTPTTNAAFPVAQQQGGSVSQPASNLSMAYDLDEVLWDSKGHLDVMGPLPTDRPNVLKILGGYQFVKGSDIGAFFYLGSGTPLTTQVTTTNQVVVFVNGRGDLASHRLLGQV